MFLRALPEDSSFLSLSLSLSQAVLYTHSKNNWNFSRKVNFLNNRALFTVDVWFLNHVAKACWWVQQQDETAIIFFKVFVV